MLSNQWSVVVPYRPFRVFPRGTLHGQPPLRALHRLSDALVHLRQTGTLQHPGVWGVVGKSHEECVAGLCKGNRLRVPWVVLIIVDLIFLFFLK